MLSLAARADAGCLYLSCSAGEQGKAVRLGLDLPPRGGGCLRCADASGFLSAVSCHRQSSHSAPPRAAQIALSRRHDSLEKGSGVGWRAGRVLARQWQGVGVDLSARAGTPQSIQASAGRGTRLSPLSYPLARCW
eukprot:13223590-Alexandrium_andersonii.AAC.1